MKTISYWFLDGSTLEIWECKCNENCFLEEFEDNMSYKSKFLTRAEAEQGKLDLIKLIKNK